MHWSDDTSPRPSPLRTIIPIVAVLGLLGYMTSEFTSDSDQVTFYLVGGMIALLVYIITFVDIILGIAVLIACMGIAPEMTIGGVPNFRLGDFIVPVLIIAWISRTARDHKPFAKSYLKGPVLAYFIVMVVSSLLAMAMGPFDERMGFLVLLKNIEYFLVLLIIANNVRTEAELKALVVFTVLVAITSSYVGLGRAYDAPTEQLLGRVNGPLGETANIFAGYLVLNVGILIGLYLHCRTNGQRLAAATGIVLIGLPLLYTYSRTSYVAVMASISLFAVTKHRRLLVIVLLIAVLFPFIAPASVYSRASTITGVVTDAGPESWVARVEAWKAAIEQLSQNPLFGMGLGVVKLGDVDNEYIRVAADLGLVGLAVFLWILIRIGRKANEVYETLAPGTFAKGYTSGYMIAFFGLVVHAIGATSFTSIRSMECFMLYTGFFVCLANHREDWHMELTTPLPSHLMGEKIVAKHIDAGI